MSKKVVDNIFQKAKQNTYFRQVLLTGELTQLVIMSIKSSESIGEEVHGDTDQILICIEGEGKAILDEEEIPFTPETVVLVPKGVKHDFVNTGNTDLKIVTTYSPSHHPEGTVHKTKEEAQKAEGTY